VRRLTISSVRVQPDGIRIAQTSTGSVQILTKIAFSPHRKQPLQQSHENI